MGQKERAYAVSTDIIGPYGTIAQLRAIYKPMFEAGIITQGELIGLKIPKTLELLREAQDGELDFTCIHGPAGKDGSGIVNHLKLQAASWYMMSLDEAVTSFGSQHELLVHAPVVYEARNYSYILSKFDQLKFLWIENHSGSARELDQAIQIVLSLRSQRYTNVGLTFDGCHVIGARNLRDKKLFRQQWDMMLDQMKNKILTLEDRFGLTVPLRLHFAIGENLEDSFPIDDRGLLSDQMLRDHASLVSSISAPMTIVFEAQRDGVSIALPLTRTDKLRLSRRQNDCFERLIKTGNIQY